jgi:hypothetical protein
VDPGSRRRAGPILVIGEDAPACLPLPITCCRTPEGSSRAPRGIVKGGHKRPNQAAAQSPEVGASSDRKLPYQAGSPLSAMTGYSVRRRGGGGHGACGERGQRDSGCNAPYPENDVDLSSTDMLIPWIVFGRESA